MTTVAKLRETILRCAREAKKAEPNNVEYRLHSFIAKLSGSLEGMGELDLDAALWQLLETKPAPCPLAVSQPVADALVAMTWWNSITEERRRHWLSVAGTAVPADAWRAFAASGSVLAVGG